MPSSQLRNFSRGHPTYLCNASWESAAGRKLRDRVALIEILPILRKAESGEENGTSERVPFCGRN